MPTKIKNKQMVTNTPALTKPSAQLKVTVVEIVDIHEKMLKYLVIENTQGGRTVINVGEKTYNNVKELINGTTKFTSPKENKEDKKK